MRVWIGAAVAAVVVLAVVLVVAGHRPDQPVGAGGSPYATWATTSSNKP